MTWRAQAGALPRGFSADSAIPVNHVLRHAALGSLPGNLDDSIIANVANFTGFLKMLAASSDAKVSSFTCAASRTDGDNLALPQGSKFPPASKWHCRGT